MTAMTSRRRLVLPALAVAAGLALAGCGSTDKTLQVGSSATTTPPGNVDAEGGAEVAGESNDADVAFVAAMVAHHEQAVTLADEALTKSQNADVKRLATAIKTAQGAELATMRGWQSARGIESDEGTSEATDAHDDAQGRHGADDHTATSGPSPSPTATHEGMVSDADMAKLTAATGADFDKLWLDLMITHHEGAVAMAEAHAAAGANPDITALTKQIITTQKAEITELTSARAKLG